MSTNKHFSLVKVNRFSCKTLPDVSELVARGHLYLVPNNSPEKQQLFELLLIEPKSKSKPKFFYRKHFPEEQHELLRAFLSLFPHRYDYIFQQLQDDNLTDIKGKKIKASWITAKQNYKLLDGTILKSICHRSDKIYGCRFDNQSLFIVLDIDAGGEYHNLKSIRKLEALLKKVGLKYVIYQSSSSGGWHLYIHFRHALSSYKLHQVLSDLLEYYGFRISNGNLEVYPNPGTSPRSTGFGLRLPLQYGFAFLNQTNLQVAHERCELSEITAINYFMNDRESQLNSTAAFEKVVGHVLFLQQKELTAKSINPTQINKGGSKPYNKTIADGNQQATLLVLPTKDAKAQLMLSIWGKQLPTGMNPEQWLEGREYYQTGLTAKSQRSRAISTISHYLFYGDKSKNILANGYGFEEQRDRLITQWLQSKHNGCSEEINSGSPDAYKQITRLTHSNLKNKQPYYGDAYRKANERKAEAKKNEIRSWVKKLKAKGIKSQKAFHRLTGITEKTLAKYRHLWKQLLLTHKKVINLPVDKALKTNNLVCAVGS